MITLYALSLNLTYYLRRNETLETYLSGFASSYTIFDKTKALSTYKPRDPFAQ